MALLAFNFAQDVVDALAQEDRVGLIFIDEFGHRRDYRFAEIASQSARYAAVFRAFGIARGERVALCTSNTAKCLFAMLALERLGAVRVPCMEAWSEAQTLECITGSQATTVVTNRAHRPRLERLRERMPGVTRFILIGEEQEGWARLDALAERAQPYAGVETAFADPTLVVNGALYTQAALNDLREDARARAGIASTDRVWCTAPMGCEEWIANVLLGAWSCGAGIVLQEGDFRERERLDLTRELDVTILLQPAPEYALQADLQDIAQFRVPRLRRCVSLGGEVESRAAQIWSDALHVPIESPVNAVRLLQKT